ncbi:MAG: nucleotidyltransferase family protein [Proteobacteria bacterium]|nr:nucleotidyltransferase family protein [Pseudomonadota bacterium]
MVSLEDSVSTWPETCTSVGITKIKVGKVEVFAPFGLDDLLGMIIRRNPRRVDIKTYNKRIREKKYPQTWEG